MFDPKPFQTAVAPQRLAHITQSVQAYNWDAMPELEGWSAGPPKPYMRELADHWVNAFDWRVVEALRNQLPQYTVTIDGQTIHYLHFRGSRPDRVPLLLLHGWPGSIYEFEDMIATLRKAGSCFDVIVPSLPGYGFSLPLKAPIGPRGTARLFHQLMQGLGHDEYVVQGGDWGSIVASWMAFDQPQACRGIHLNMFAVHAADVRPETEAELAHAARRVIINQVDDGYRIVQTTKPQALGYAMAASPVGVAAWIVDKLVAWSDMPRDAMGEPLVSARYTIEEVVTFVMAYLATPSFVTSFWMYHGRMLERSSAFPAGTRIITPLAAACFHADAASPPPPRSLIERTWNVKQWNEYDRGGHFAAMEQPDVLAADVLAFYQSL